MEKVCFKTKKGPAALGPYSTATIYGGVIYLSGMIGVNPQTGKAPEGGTLAQAAQAFENIKTVLGELGADTADVLKTTVYLTNMADFGEVIRREPAWRFPRCRWGFPSRWSASPALSKP